jgi:V/A-type H+-transporting ATPase subunit F
MNFYVIGDSETVLGFRLAGVHGRIVESPEETEAALTELFSQEGIGIILIPERVAESVRNVVDRYLYTTSFPLIIEIPDRLGPLEGRGSIRDMIRNAVGISF